MMCLSIRFTASSTGIRLQRLCPHERFEIDFLFRDKLTVPIFTTLITTPEYLNVTVPGPAAHGAEFLMPAVDTVHRMLSHSSSVVPRSIAARAHHDSSSAALRWQTGRASDLRIGMTGGVKVRWAYDLPARAPVAPVLDTIRSASSSLCRRSFSFHGGEQRFSLYQRMASHASLLDKPKRKHSQATRSVALWPPLPLMAAGNLFK